jgi:hypothetical protein
MCDACRHLTYHCELIGAHDFSFTLLALVDHTLNLIDKPRQPIDVPIHFERDRRLSGCMGSPQRSGRPIEQFAGAPQASRARCRLPLVNDDSGGRNDDVQTKA